MRIAIITAMTEETLPILNKIGNVVDESVIANVKIRKIISGNNVIYLATSGIGEVRAALAVQLVKDLFDVDVVLNFGFVGALNPALNIGELVIAKAACHYQFDLSPIDGTKVGQYDGHDDIYLNLDNDLRVNVLQTIGMPLKSVNVASSDKFVAEKKDKEYLFNELHCDICEMELAGIQLACERNNIPLLSIKVVSDKADESAKEDFNVVVEKGVAKYAEILPSILKVLDGEKTVLPPVLNNGKN